MKRRHDPYTRGVSLQEHLEKVLAIELANLKAGIALERKLMEDRMAGFPTLFVRKGDTDVAIAQLASDLKSITEAISEIKAMQLPRKEFDMQHGVIMEKVGVLERKTANMDKIITDLESIEKRTQGVELLKAEITGKIWTLGIALSIMLITLEFMLRYVLKLGN